MDRFMNFEFNVNKIVLATYVQPGSGAGTHKNRPSHGLAMSVGGLKEYVFSDGTYFTLKQNEIIYLPKNSCYKVSSIENGGCFAVNFDIPDEVSFPPFTRLIKNNAELLKCFRDAEHVWNLREHSYVTKCKADLYNIIYTIRKEYFAEYMPKSKLEFIKPAIKYIHDSYITEKISIEKLSALCGISPEYFRKIFKSFYGVSPVNYINNLRLSRARELLESGLYSVAEAASLSGFNEMCYFSREFKKAIGMTPSEYAKNNKC